MTLGPRLDAALAAWRTAGRTPRFWLRDDDAVAPTEALDRLLDLCGRHDVPVAIAVVPAHAEAALARRLDGHPGATVLVHGWSHDNHAPVGAKKQELGLHRPADTVLAELAMARDRIAAVFGSQAAGVLVPPWNRIDATLIPRLPAIGFHALSVFGPPKPGALPMINPTVDIIDWHGTRGCRDPDLLAAEIAGQLDACFSDPALPPIGILTHHLVHDEAAWQVLEDLFAVTARFSGNPWRPIGDFLPSASVSSR